MNIQRMGKYLSKKLRNMQVVIWLADSHKQMNEYTMCSWAKHFGKENSEDSQSKLIGLKCFKLLSKDDNGLFT